jgi:hypothetical protein
MSGSSGPDLPGGGFGDGGTDANCQQLRLSRWLQGLIPGVADHLHVGEVLDVTLQEGPPAVVALITQAGQVAGSVVPTRQLLDCLRRGVSYVAEVRSAALGAIEVEIQAAAA